MHRCGRRGERRAHGLWCGTLALPGRVVRPTLPRISWERLTFRGRVNRTTTAGFMGRSRYPREGE